MVNPLGDARTSTEAELQERLGEDTGGIYLGRFYDPVADDAPSEIRYQRDRHLLVFGPTGSGKTTRFLIPNLLLGLENESVIVIDPKGEVARETADHRRRLDHDVVILNPFNIGGLGSAGFNPLAWLDPDDTNFFDDAAALGEALIKIEGSEPHWSESAQGLITALLMWEKLTRGKKASLENIRAMLTEANDWEPAADAEGRKFQRQVSGLRVTAGLMTLRGGFEIASLASRFTGQSDELASIQSTADTQTRWLLSRPMRADLKRPGFDFRDLKKKPTTVYVILPAERLRTHSVWLRLVIVSALRSLYSVGGIKTVMMVDEMAALGHLAPLEDAFALVRGYNVQIAAILQDLSQLKGLYKERWETFIANAGAVLGFAPNDLTTAEWMSKRTGQTTVVASGFSRTSNTSPGGQGSGTGMTDQQMARPVFLPHELIGLEEGMGMLWLASLAHTTQVFMPYYKNINACISAQEGVAEAE